MLDRTSLNAIARQLRTLHDRRPKGAIPDRIWRLLLDLERTERASDGAHLARIGETRSLAASNIEPRASGPA